MNDKDKLLEEIKQLEEDLSTIKDMQETCLVEEISFLSRASLLRIERKTLLEDCLEDLYNPR